MSATKIDPLIPLLRPLGRRLRLRNAHRLITRSLWLPLLVATLVLGAGWLFPLARYQQLAWIPLGLWLLGVLSYALLHPLPPARVARHSDAELALHDRLATALELTQTLPLAEKRFDNELITRQREDALQLAQTLDPRSAFPLQWPQRLLALAGGCLAAALLLSMLPNPMDAILKERQNIAAAAKDEAAQLEELAEELAENAALDEAEKEELLRELREAVAKLEKNPGDREEALADLANLEEKLRERLDPQNAARQAALENLASDLGSLAKAENQDPSLDEAAQLLQELAENADELSAEEREALAAALESAAGQLAGNDSGLAGELSQLAQNVRNGTLSPGDAQAASNALSKANNDAALQQSVAQALNQAQNSQSALSQAGQGQQQAAAQGQGQGQGQGQDQGQGQGQTGGGGTNSPTGQPSTRQGRAGDPVDPNKAFAVRDQDSVFAPWQRGKPGDEDFLPGRQGDQGQEITREELQTKPGTTGASLVPYAEVLTSYTNAAAETMEREYIPTGLKDYVRDYFTSLEP